MAKGDVEKWEGTAVIEAVSDNSNETLKDDNAGRIDLQSGNFTDCLIIALHVRQLRCGPSLLLSSCISGENATIF